MAYSLKYSYNSTSQSYSVTGWSGITTSDNVVIPSTYDDGTNGEHPVTSIGDRAFSSCSSLTSVVIPDGVTSIGKYAFYGCSSLTSIEIPDSVTSIGNGAFRGCSSLTSITIPDGVTSIGKYAFYGCSSLTSVVIPDGVTSIGDYAFEYCSSLASVTIPDSVTSIGDMAFIGCTNLKQLILFPSSPPTLGSTNAIPSTISKIYVQQSSKAKYQAATNWKSFANNFVADDMRLYFTMSARAQKKYFASKEWVGTEVQSLQTKDNIWTGLNQFDLEKFQIGSSNDITDDYYVSFLENGVELRSETWNGGNPNKDAYWMPSIKLANDGPPEYTEYKSDKIIYKIGDQNSGLYSELIFPEGKTGTIALIEDLSDSNLNLENGSGKGSVQQSSFTYSGEDVVFQDGSLGTQYGDIVEGAKAIGDQSIALGGLRWDYVNEDEDNFGRTPTSAEGRQSFAAGGSVHAYGDWSVAMGKDVKAYQGGSVSLGGGTKAGMSEADWVGRYGSLDNKNATGQKYKNSLSFATSLGDSNNAIGRASFSAGKDNTSKGDNSITLGKSNIAEGDTSIAIGLGSKSTGSGAISLANDAIVTSIWDETAKEYIQNIISQSEARGELSLVLQSGQALGKRSIAMLGGKTEPSADNSLALGRGAYTTHSHSVAIGGTNHKTKALNYNAIAIGSEMIASGDSSVAIGLGPGEASGTGSIIFGRGTASGPNSIAMLAGTSAGDRSLAIGGKAFGQNSIAIGYGSKSGAADVATTDNPETINGNAIAIGGTNGGVYSSNWNAIAIGNKGTNAKGNSSIAIGNNCISEVSESFTLGLNNVSKGWGALAMGINCTSEAWAAYTLGYYCTSKTAGQLTVGKYNSEVEGALFVVGNGSSGSLSNALEVYENGQIKASGNTDVLGKLNVTGISHFKSNLYAEKGISIYIDQALSTDKIKSYTTGGKTVYDKDSVSITNTNKELVNAKALYNYISMSVDDQGILTINGSII